MQYSIVIPAYNEQASLPNFLKELERGIDKQDCEIVVVDDGSTDSTAELAELPGVKLIRHAINKGYGAALKTGFSHASGKYVVICDADGQHRVEDVLAVMAAEDVDMVVGRRVQASAKQYNRIAGKTVLRIFANFLSGQKIPDFNSGLRKIDREFINRYTNLLPDTFSASTTMTLLMLQLKRKVLWVDICTQKRIGKSTVRQVRHGFDTMLLITRLTMLFNPLRVFLPISLTLLTFGALWGALHLTDGGGFSVLSATALIVGLIIFLFGLVADQISLMRIGGLK